MGKRKTKLNINDQIHLSKRLSFLLLSDIPISSSLEMLINHSHSKRQKSALVKVVHDVSLGETLWKSFEKSEIFSPFGIYLTEVGEMTGALGQCLGFLTDELEKKQKIKNKLLGALVYPIFIGLASILMSIMLITFVFPKILPILNGLKGELPFITKVLIIISSLVKNFGLFVLMILIIFCFITIFLFRRSLRIRLSIEKFLFSLPYFKNFLIYYHLTSLSRSLGLLLKSGLTLVKSLELIGRHSTSVLYQNSFQSIKVAIVEGNSLNISLSSFPTLFPSLFQEMINVGERTGRLHESFSYLSSLYENELEEKTRQFASMLEPMLMIFMGLIISAVALSIILPIYQITGTLR